MHSTLASSAKLVGLPASLDEWSAATTRIVFVSHSDLPPSIQFLPALFRVLALALFLPVAALAVVDIVGWAFFRFVLRPLGYASTRHFKDPEKEPKLVAVPTGDATHSPNHGPGVLPSSSESSSGASSSGASDVFPSPAYSDNASLPPESPRRGKPPALAAIKTSDLPSAAHSSSGTSTSPSSVAQQRRTPSSPTQPTRRRQRAREHVSSAASSGDESSTVRRMSRDRAPSIGLDGPLFGGEGDETDVASTPGGESDAGDYLGAGAGGGGAGGMSGAWGGPGGLQLRGDGVPRGGFKLGLTEVKSRNGSVGEGDPPAPSSL
ncbi:hypothetical protein Rhopal_004030-T1 [Rhodotorula paludigena]|uniref:Proteophosphoglycan ppg4 n=1 Tax=Rhodotorula paludigena TaxID=86838 RepID=A0AAV5GN98_9BASI|nr:hypothetical protein Rhopal_004030-T1 [Rhodotorula paludigena]